jgi:glycine dehydrogenase subunit 1
LCLRKAHYARAQLTTVGGLLGSFDAPFFKEFVVRVPHGDARSWLKAAEREGFFAGIWLGRWYPELDDCILVSVTEKRTRDEIDRLAGVFARLSRKESVVHA